MFNFEWFNKISIQKDGNCMFRAISSFIDLSLFTCRRKRDGSSVNKELKQKENNLSKSLRYIVVSYMNLHKEKFANNIFYDDDYYDSIDERIDNMIENGEFGGNLELYIMSKIYKIQINVFVRNGKGYNLISKIGKDSHTSCNLFYNNNHYELLSIKDEFKYLFNECYNEWVIENPNINFEEIVNSDHSDSEYEIV